MGERRRRKSLWDKEAETKHISGTGENNYWTGKEHHSGHESGHYHDFDASGSYRATKFRYHSGHPSLESIEENLAAPTNGSFIKSRENAPEGKEIVGGDRYYQNMSPGFKYSYSHGNDRSHSQRYLRRGRSRSRSRSRGRSRSRSLSRGRERERLRGRSSSRSRSRGRGDSSATGQTRSRSPIGDYRHQFHGGSDNRSLPEKSTEVCSDFAAGRCRRGSQCKFFHPKDTSHRDEEANISESWRNRADHDRISRHSYSSRGLRSETRDDVSDPYRGEDERFQNKGRSAVPCRDFMKGTCRWGDTCRFSHHFASDETSGKGTRYTSSNKDSGQQPYRNGKPPCKYFAVGKCDRNNCWFSHEDSISNSLKGKQGKVTDGSSSHDKDNKRNGPTWNDANRITDNVKPSGWDESFLTVKNNNGDYTNAKNDDRWGDTLVNENTNWMLERTDNLTDMDKQPYPPAGSGMHDGGLGTTESISKGNMTNKQELLMLHGSQLQNQYENLNVQGQNKLPVDQSFSMEAWQQNASQIPHIQQCGHGVLENNLASSFRSDVLDEVEDSRNAANPILRSGQNITQNGENVFPENSSIPNKIDGGQSMPCPNPSDVSSHRLNGSEVHLVANLNLQSLIQDHQKAVEMAGMLETKVPQFFPTLVTSDHPAQFTGTLVSVTGQQVAPVTNPIVFLKQGFENEQSRKNADTKVSNSMGMVHSFSDATAHAPLVDTTNIQSNPVSLSEDPINPTEDDRGTNEHGNHTEPGNQMQVGRSSPSSIAGVESNNSKVDHLGRSNLEKETVAVNSEVDEGKRAIGEESKGVKSNKCFETQEGHGKGEESIANKDDKGMRLFKNSLIEFVKEILKPTWKEGRMSREVHKTIVKKVVDKVTSTIQVEHIPKTQDKVEQYLSCSRPKIAKLVQAYVDRCLKTDS